MSIYQFIVMLPYRNKTINNDSGTYLVSFSILGSILDSLFL